MRGPGTLLAIVCALALAMCAPRAADPRGPALWRVSDADSEIWLLGTVHVLPPDLRWKTPAIEAAFARADTIWLETPLDAAASARIAALVARDGANPPGVTLSAQLAPEDRGRLSRVARALGVPVASLEPSRPWLAALQLSLAQLAKAGHSADAGVEQVLEADAAAQGKARAYLETAEQQMAVFSTLSQAAQVQFLRATLRQIEEEDGAVAEIDRAWANGDMAAFERLAAPMLAEAGPETAQALIHARNARWAGQIETMLAGEGRAFVAVGAAHMVGAQGLPALLRGRGHPVEGP